MRRERELTEEAIQVDYQKKRRELEADEDVLKSAQREGAHWIQETLSANYYTTQNSAVNSEIKRDKQLVS